MDIDIRDDRTADGSAGEYVLVVEGEEAGELSWRAVGGRRAITHTGVHPRLRGQGLAGDLMARALDDARSEGVSVDPLCSYAARYVDEHPEYVDLVARSA